jgi:hypothetical protein
MKISCSWEKLNVFIPNIRQVDGNMKLRENWEKVAERCFGDTMNTVWQLVIPEGHKQLTPISLRVICVMLLEMSLESYQMLVKTLFLARGDKEGSIYTTVESARC